MIASLYARRECEGSGGYGEIFGGGVWVTETKVKRRMSNVECGIDGGAEDDCGGDEGVWRGGECGCVGGESGASYGCGDGGIDDIGDAGRGERGEGGGVWVEVRSVEAFQRKNGSMLQRGKGGKN